MQVKEEYSRTAWLLGTDGIARLASAHVAVFGIGGVGGFLCEALARAGVGALDLIDNDTVARSNINRQIIALQSTVGRPKVEVMADRIRDINPDCRVRAMRCFYLPEQAEQFDFSAYDYIADAIDTVSAKLDLALQAHNAGVPILSAMGAGNKLDPSQFVVEDISKTSVCPLARVMRVELRKRGIQHMKVVYSKEKPLAPMEDGEQPSGSRRTVPGSVSFVPSVVGLLMAGEIVRDLLAPSDR